MFKEVKTFIRTPTQWSQLIIIGAMVVVFILNLRSIPTPHPSVTLLVAFLNMGLAVFVAIGLNSRFVFTTIPGEGDGLIHLLASPYTKSRFLRFKLVFYLVPQLVIGFSLFFIGDTMLGLDPFFRFAGVIFLLPVLVFLTVLALYLGLFVNSRSSISPQHLLLTLPGISYMLGSIVYTICCLVFFSRPLFLFYFNIYRWKPVPFGTIFLWIAFFLAVNAALIFLIYTRAQSRWAQRELP